MEGLTFRKANPDDIDLMTQARVTYCMREEPRIDKTRYESLYEDVKNWTLHNMAKGHYVGYFGYLSGEVVCFAGLVLNDLPPLLNQTQRTQGYVVSFFTYPPP